MNKNEIAAKLSDQDLHELVDLIKSGKNKNARWESLKESELYRVFGPDFTKSDFLEKTGIERITREFIEKEGRDSSLSLLRDCLKKGWVYEFDKPPNMHRTIDSGLGIAFVLGLFSSFLFYYFSDAESLPNTIFKVQSSYKKNEFASYQEKALYEEVKVKPAKDISGNLSGYRELAALNPDKEIYKTKIQSYTAKEQSARESSLRADKASKNSSYASTSNRYSESEAKRLCQSRLMAQEPDISRICSTRNCISREVENRFGSCMRSFNYAR